MSNWGLARHYPGAGGELTRYDKREIVRDTNRIIKIGDTARVALDEMTNNYMTAEQLAAQALTAAHCVAQGVPQTEVSQAYLNTLTQHFLQRMVTATNLANDQIIRTLHNNHQRGDY